MTSPTKQKIEIEFTTSMPLGTRGMFKRDNEFWIAIPLKKYTDICALVDRLVGMHAKTADDMVRWINTWPQDAPRVALVLSKVKEARRIHREIVVEKTRVRTS